MECLINAECSIQHILLHLKELYLAEGELLEDVFLSKPDEEWFMANLPSPTNNDTPTPVETPAARNSGKRGHHKSGNISPPVAPKFEPTVWLLDLVDSETGTPLDLSSKHHKDFLLPIVEGRRQYFLCKVRKNLQDENREIVPLLYDPPAELLALIDQHVVSAVHSRKSGSSKKEKSKRSGGSSPAKGTNKPAGKASHTAIRKK